MRIVDCVVTEVEVVAEQPITVEYEYGGPKRISLPEIKPTPDFCTVGFDFEGVYSSYPDNLSEFARIEDGELVIDTADTSLHRTTEPVLVAFKPLGSSD